jgi:hypothetical protein
MFANFNWTTSINRDVEMRLERIWKSFSDGEDSNPMKRDIERQVRSATKGKIGVFTKPRSKKCVGLACYQDGTVGVARFRSTHIYTTSSRTNFTARFSNRIHKEILRRPRASCVLVSFNRANGIIVVVAERETYVRI